jgi:hypothetical protein
MILLLLYRKIKLEVYNPLQKSVLRYGGGEDKTLGIGVNFHTTVIIHNYFLCCIR